MESLLPFIPVALLVLACPLMMVGMGVGVWLVARARGEKRQLSLTCMPGHSEQNEPVQAHADAEKLKEQISRLQEDLQALKTSVNDPSTNG